MWDGKSETIDGIQFIFKIKKKESIDGLSYCTVLHQQQQLTLFTFKRDRAFPKNTTDI